MTVGLVSIGSAVDLMDASFSGFDYPNNAQVVQLLSDGSSAPNAVLQQSGLPFRQATLALLAEEADALLIRGYYETRTEVTFTDFDGTTSSVRMLDFSRSMRMTGLWDVTVTMIETVAPVAGS